MYFKEKKECVKLIQEIIRKEEGYEVDLDKVLGIVNEYQEMSSILDPHLGDLIIPVMKVQKRFVIENANGGGDFPFKLYRNGKMDALFKVMYQLCKIRGYKSIVKQLPHQAKDLEPVVCLLQCVDKMDYSCWETRYVGLLWLSMLVLVPFDLKSIDSRLGKGTTLVESIITICKQYLKDAGPTREAAAVCLARLLTRPDMEQVHIVEFLHFAVEILKEYMEERECDKFLMTGVLLTLSNIGQFAHRKHYLTLIPIYFQTVVQLHSKHRDTEDTLQRKLVVKLIQRIGLTLLPVREIPWRYMRGTRTLNLNNNSTHDDGDDGLQQVENTELQDVDIDVPKEMEDIVEILLCGLRDKDTVVRWSAAKGIGRITGTLPFQFADDVVQCVLELFTESESDAAWHGASLAIAELARRGLLLPTRLAETIKAVLLALQYDVRRGSNSVGQHVRDAACYMCWAFARAYAPQVLRPYVLELAKGMIVTAIFDREVNCRRAASAAFQECVGRQGHANFPHGIDILTQADYFTLGNRTNAYLNVSVNVANFKTYRYCLIDKCFQVHFCHWDEQIRQLTAKALHNLTFKDPEYMQQIVLPKLIHDTLSKDLFIRHGATLAVAEITLALASCPVFVRGEIVRHVRNIVPKVEKARLYRGKGGENMRFAICRLIECIAKSHYRLTRRTQLRLLDTIDECIKHPNENIQQLAIKSYRALCGTYFANDADPKSLLKRTLDKYLSLIQSPNVAFRRGYVRAIGATPSNLLLASNNMLQTCIDALCGAIKIEENEDERDAECRKSAILATIELCEQVDVRHLTPSMTQLVFSTFLEAMNDYSTDNRGDVGSWVRGAAMLALERFVILLAKSEHGLNLENSTSTQNIKMVNVPGFGLGQLVGHVGEANPAIIVEFDDASFGHWYFGGRGVFAQRESFSEESIIRQSEEEHPFVIPALEPRKAYLSSSPTSYLAASAEPHRHLTCDMIKSLICALLKQASEKLDVIRETAGTVLGRLIVMDSPRIPWIPDRPALNLHLKDNHSINWASPQDSFLRVVNLLSVHVYMPSIVAGLVISVGGLTESVVKHSRGNLIEWFRKQLKLGNFGLLSNVSNELVKLCADHKHEDRIIVPAFITIGILLDRNLFDFLHKDGSAFGLEIYRIVSTEVKKCNNVTKLNAAVSILIGLLPSNDPVERKAFQGLLAMLGHRYPMVRKTAAEQLYTKFLVHELLKDEIKADLIKTILSETNWNDKLATVRTKREPLYEHLKIERALKQPAASL